MNTPNEDAICECYGTVKKLTGGGCSDDLMAVSTLPDSWVPQRSSPTLTEYLKEREQNYNKVLEELLQDAARVNRDVDEKIRTIAEILLSDIKQNQADIECVIEKSKPDEGMLSIDDRNKALEEITQLFTQRMQDFAKFKQEALELESYRADGIRTIFKIQFQRLIAIGHKTPKDLLHDFDDKIYEVNQQLLSNSRAYIDLESQLKVQLDQSAINARSALNQLCLTKPKSVKGRSVSPWIRKSESDTKISNRDDRKKVKGQSEKSKGFLVDLEEFNICVSQLVEVYRNTIFKLYTGYSNSLMDLYKDYNHRNIGKYSTDITTELKNIIQYALEHISDTNVQIKGFVYKDLEEMARNDVQHIHQSLSSIGKLLLDTYVLLFDVGKIWNDHILRSTLVQKLILAAVEDLQNIHDTVELPNEIPFNVTLELLRYAPDIDKLQYNYDVAINQLKQTADMNQNHSNIEIAKLEEYLNLPSVMANIFLAECNVFLENRPKIIDEPSEKPSPAGFAYFNSKSAVTLSAPLPRAILQTDLQEMALKKWKNDFMSSFEYNLPTMSEELHRQARKWINERSVQLNMRHSLKRMSHGIRAERVTAAREARLAELRFHEDRLNSHLEAMYDRIDRLPSDAASFLSLEASELYPFCKWIQGIQDDMDILLSSDPDPEVKRLKMLSYASRIVKHKEQYQDSLDLAIDMNKKDIQREIQMARISNFNFMSQLKLFMEGGRYAAVEATKTCAALIKAADALEVCVNRSMDALNGRRAQLLALADQQLLPLQRVLDEVIKFPKNDKKKPTVHKK